MYYRYFGLKEAPFSIAVNPRYLYMSAHHRDALAHLLYGVGEGGGFVLLTGEVGTGKTTIIRSLLEQLPEHTDIAMVFNPALNAEELLATVCDELGVTYSQAQPSLKTLTDNLHRFLLQNHAKGRNTVLLIDEAQHLQSDVLEQIRLLTNLETNTKKLLQIILVGQPELRSLLNRAELRQLAQRITARYQLKPLSLQETADYIRHRLQVAGLPANQTLFPKSVVKATFRASRGIPRIINVLCDRMLLGTYGRNKTVVDMAMFRQASAEVVGEGEPLAQGINYGKALVIILLAGLLLSGFYLWQTQPLALSSAHTNVEVYPPAQSNVPASPPEPALTSPDSEQVPPPTAINWYNSKNDAINQLLLAIGAQADNLSACDSPSSNSLRCEQVNVKSWQELQGYNRPAVLTLITKAKMLRFAVVLGFNQDYAFVRSNNNVSQIALAEIGELWTGDALFFWQANSAYTGPVAINDRNPLVKWLAKTFADLDHQDSPLTDDLFNAPLQKRVMLFQQENHLQADGVVGLQTLLKLNEQIATPITLIDDLPDNTAAQSIAAGEEG